MSGGAHTSRNHIVVAAVQRAGAEARAREIAFVLAGRGHVVTVLLAGVQDERSVHRFGDVTLIRIPVRSMRGLAHRSRRRATGALKARLLRRGLTLRTSLEESGHRGTRRSPARLLPGLARLRDVAQMIAERERRTPRPAGTGAGSRALTGEMRLLSPDAVHALDGSARRAVRVAYPGDAVSVLGEAPAGLAHATPAPAPAAHRRLLVGPRNGNGQAWAWARTAEASGNGVEAVSLAVGFHAGSVRLDFPADVRVTLDDWSSRRWQRWWADHVLADFTHVLIETGEPALGGLHGDDAFADVPILREAGLQVGLVFRGSELRDPRAHAGREPHSPFADPSDPLTTRLQERVDHLHARLGSFDGPCYVTTLDLLDDLPRATWLPHVLDLERWAVGPPVLQRRRPVVVHAPTRESLKGSGAVDAVCEALAAAGRIEYRRLRGIPSLRMPDALRAADILIDQLVNVGSYGALSLQGMATGRVVIANVSDLVRGRLDAELPILQATPDTLGEILAGVLAGHGEPAAIAAAGRAHVERYHSGAYSAERLVAFLSR